MEYCAILFRSDNNNSDNYIVEYVHLHTYNLFPLFQGKVLPNVVLYTN